MPRIEPSIINLNADIDTVQVKIHFHVNGR